MTKSDKEDSNALIEIKENPLKFLWNSGLKTKRSSQRIKDDMREEFNAEFVQK